MFLPNLFILFFVIGSSCGKHSIIFRDDYSPPASIPADEHKIYSVPLNQIISQPLLADLMNNGIRVTGDLMEEEADITFSVESIDYDVYTHRKTTDEWKESGGKLCQWAKNTRYRTRQKEKFYCGRGGHSTMLDHDLQVYDGLISIEGLFHHHTNYMAIPASKRVFKVTVLLPNFATISNTTNPVLIETPAWTLEFTDIPSTVVANNPFNISIAILDVNRNVMTAGLDSTALVELRISWEHTRHYDMNRILQSTLVRMASPETRLHPVYHVTYIRKRARSGLVTFTDVRILDVHDNLNLNASLKQAWLPSVQDGNVYKQYEATVMSLDKRIRDIVLSPSLQVKAQIPSRLVLVTPDGDLPKKNVYNFPFYPDLEVELRDYNGNRVYSGPDSILPVSTVIKSAAFLSYDSGFTLYGGRGVFPGSISTNRVVDKQDRMTLYFQVLSSVGILRCRHIKNIILSDSLHLATFYDHSKHQHYLDFTKVAVRFVNKMNKLPKKLPVRERKLIVDNLDNKSDLAHTLSLYKSMIRIGENDPSNRVRGVVGMGSNFLTENMNPLLSINEMPTVAVMETTSEFSNKKLYPYFNRICWNEYDIFLSLFLAAKSRHWNNIVVISQENEVMSTAFFEEAAKHRVDILAEVVIPEDIGEEQLGNEMKKIKEKSSRIIFFFIGSPLNGRVLRAAIRNEIACMHGYQWVTVEQSTWEFPWTNSHADCKERPICTVAFKGLHAFSSTYPFLGRFFTPTITRFDGTNKYGLYQVLPFHFSKRAIGIGDGVDEVDRAIGIGGGVDEVDRAIGIGDGVDEVDRAIGIGDGVDEVDRAIGIGDGVDEVDRDIVDGKVDRAIGIGDGVDEVDRAIGIGDGVDEIDSKRFINGRIHFDKSGNRPGYYGLLATVNPHPPKLATSAPSVVVYNRMFLGVNKTFQWELQIKALPPLSKSPWNYTVVPVALPNTKYIATRSFVTMSMILTNSTREIDSALMSGYRKVIKEKVIAHFFCKFGCGGKQLYSTNVRLYEFGNCTEMNKCRCAKGYYGPWCQRIMCQCHYGHCKVPNVCTCFEGWSGDNCFSPVCESCVHGTCSKPNLCKCDPAWSGKDCNTTFLYLFFAAVCGVCCLGLFLALLVRSLSKRNAMNNLDWLVWWEDVHLSETKSQNIATWRTYLCYIQRFNIASLNVNDQSLRRDIVILKSLKHQNIVAFIGACLQAPNVCLLVELCPKGSLEDLLANQDVPLHWDFRFSILKDICHGMAYIHNDIYSHGRLKSSNCLIDRRWVCKIAGHGCPTMRYKAPRLSSDLPYYNRDRTVSSLFWTSPELLRKGSCLSEIHRGTKEGDVYSFGIILSEVITHEKPFAFERSVVKDSDIINLVMNLNFPQNKNAITVLRGLDVDVTDVFRPSIDKTSMPERIQPRMMSLLENAWNQDPKKRPTFKNLLRELNLMHPVKGGFVDNLVNMLQNYSTELETLVAEKTRDLIAEKLKTEELVSQLLPEKVAKELHGGGRVDPESFDCVTIFFSDIVGFTTIAQYSTPLQVVALLNDLYSMFDRILDRYNVYKVETIGDAYMVVGGIPVRSGNQHAGEIATMSLDLVASIVGFKIRHMPNKVLHLRVGIHSGPVVAGVVGRKMPRYCLTGDAVNTASRMESTSKALKIHISEATAKILSQLQGYYIKCRGETEIKGKGKMITYWLLGKRDFMTQLPSSGEHDD
ncbi:uncharacterized protein LOC121389840 [Gigantopelta aegis]|uniref:uncharacterized protein LOC121389840 n=1 Tax=Gigantopelta aegis TaxID=1735272 RepID=UPI001B88E209|nr:uncharacterized protein LOC121389840 [Gigantopelta aegis]